MSVLLLAATGVVVWSQAGNFLESQELTIAQFKQLPTGSVGSLEAAVTFVDSAEHRAWLQDKSGAMAVPLSAADAWVRAGESVRVEAAKVSRTSTQTELEANAKISRSRNTIELPKPLRVSLRNWSDADEGGKRVEVSAIVREVSRDQHGRAVLYLADAGPEVEGVIADPHGHLESLVNTRVSVTGVPETLQNEHGAVTGRRLLIQNSDDVRVEEPAPPETPVDTVRSLYRTEFGTLGHRVRIRGVVVAEPTPTSIVLEDDWGTISCDSSEPQVTKPGQAVEVEGYPGVDGLRLDLYHATVHAVPAEISPNEIVGATKKVTSIAAIRRLPQVEAAQALPTDVEGVITYVDPDWRQMFIQNGRDAIYVKYSGSREKLAAGERVRVMGLTNPGNYAPIIVAPKLRVLGNAELPHARGVTPMEAASGALDSQFVELEGVVHPLRMGEESNHVTFELYSPIGQIHVYVAPNVGAADELRRVEDAKVRVRGVFGTVFNSRRQLVGYQMSVSSPRQIQLLEPSATRNFDAPITPIAAVLQYSPDPSVGHRIHVQGSVTMVGRDFFYLQDATGGMQVRGNPGVLNVGDLADVIGYASPGGSYSPTLDDAMIRPLDGQPSVPPKITDAEEILQGQYDSQLVSLQGRLLAVVDLPSGRNLVLQSGAYTFTAQADNGSGVGSMRLTEGSTLTVAGVCSVQVNPSKLYLLLQDVPPLSFKVLLRSPDDVAVVRPAPWWNIERILFVAVGLVVAILFTLAWISVLRRRVRKQSEKLRKAAETAQAIKDLAGAMRDVSEMQDFTARVSVRGKDDIAQLVVGFNNMLDELQLREAAKLEAESKLQQQALTDELTGLPNRRLLSDRLEQTLAIAQRDGRMVALLYIDLDGFKLVNDSLGHTIGDLLLSQVAQRLRSRVRYSDTLARLGGDEFTVVLTRARKKEDAQLVAGNLLKSLAAPFLIEGHEIRIGASIGVSMFPENGATATDLLQQSDSAMYAAKRNGKNQVMFFTESVGNSVRERLTLESELSSAITNADITLHYQPEFDLATGGLVRFEALARWSHPTLGAIAPSKFIPVAEESGLIVALGAYVMERACREAVAWQRISKHPVQVAVNVSSIQFARDTFVNEVMEVLAKTGLRPELLQIELTESAMLNGVERVVQAIQSLRTAGVSVAIDDFGTGYSCLSYLPRLSFDALKIDGSFVKELGIRPETRAMVHALVTLAHNLGMKVIAEGVETEQQLHEIRGLGGDEVQGFLLGRPNGDPAETLRERHRAGKSGIAVAPLESMAND